MECGLCPKPSVLWSLLPLTATMPTNTTNASSHPWVPRRLTPPPSSEADGEAVVSHAWLCWVADFHFCRNAKSDPKKEITHRMENRSWAPGRTLSLNTIHQRTVMKWWRYSGFYSTKYQSWNAGVSCESGLDSSLLLALWYQQTRFHKELRRQGYKITRT